MSVVLDIEREIAASLTDQDACRTYIEMGIGDFHFSDTECRAIYSFAINYYRDFGRGLPPTLDILELEFPGYVSIVGDAKGAAPSYLAERLFNLYIKRQTEETLRTFAPMLAKDARYGATMLRDAMSMIIDSSLSTPTLLEYGADLDAYRDMMQKRRERNGVPYPWKEMQEHTGGIREGELAILIGPAGMGKSIVACKAALEAVRSGHKVYFASLELDVGNIAERIEFMVANEDAQRVPVANYSAGAVRPEYYQAICEAQEKIAAMPGRLFIENPRVEDRTPTALVRACKANGCDFLIVDQLQFVTKPRRDSLQESIGAALQEFKQQIMSPSDGIKLPMLLLHQMNREGTREQRKGSGKVGSITAIAGSAWVEQIADIVWGIGRSEEEANVDKMNIATLKTRNVSPVGWQLDWDVSMRYRFEIAHDVNGNAIRLDSWQ